MPITLRAILRLSLGALALLLLAGSPSVHASQAKQHAAFAFEGEIVRTGDALAQHLQPRNILSGSFRWNLATHPEPSEPAFAVYPNAIDYAEFTLDRNYIAIAEGGLDRSQANHVVIHLGDTREPQPDSLALHLPVTAGSPLAHGLRPTRLELFFRDDNARALQSTNLPNHAPTFPQAWFTLTWQDDSGEQSTLTEGIITRLHLLAASPAAEPTHAELQTIIRDLDHQLRQRDQHIDRLTHDLEAARQQVDSLQATLTQTREALAQAEDGSTARALETRNATLRRELSELQTLQTDTREALAQTREREEQLRLSHEQLLLEIAQLRTPPTAPLSTPPPGTHLREAPRYIQLPESAPPTPTAPQPQPAPEEPTPTEDLSPEPEPTQPPVSNTIRRGPRR